MVMPLIAELIYTKSFNMTFFMIHIYTDYDVNEMQYTDGTFDISQGYTLVTSRVTGCCHCMPISTTTPTTTTTPCVDCPCYYDGKRYEVQLFLSERDKHNIMYFKCHLK